MGFFDKLLGRKTESAAKSPEAKKPVEQPAPAAPGKELPSGVRLKQEQASDAATSEATVQRIQNMIRGVKPETKIINMADSVAPGQKGHEELQSAVQRVGNFMRSMDEAIELGTAKGDVTYGGETSADVQSMIEGGRTAGSGIEGAGFAGAKKAAGYADRGQEGGGMFRLSDMQNKPEAPDKKRAA